MCFTESNLKNPELSNKVCRETKRLNRSTNLIGLIESKNDAAGITSKGFSVCSLRSDQNPTALRYSGFSSLEYCFSEIKKAISTITSYSFQKKSDAAGITSKGFSVCLLRSDQTPTALRLLAFQKDISLHSACRSRS